MLKNYSNMGMTDRAVRASVGVVLVYLAFFNPEIIRNQLLNVLVGAFGVLNIISSIVKICPLYLLIRFSTATNRDAASKEKKKPSNLNNKSKPAEVTTLRRKLLLSVFLPMTVLLLIFSSILSNLSHQYDMAAISKKPDVAAELIAEELMRQRKVSVDLEATTLPDSVLAAVQSGLRETALLYLHDSNGNAIASNLDKGVDDRVLFDAITDLNRNHNGRIGDNARGMLMVAEDQYIWSTVFSGMDDHWFTSVTRAPPSHTMTKQFLSAEFVVIMLSVIFMGIWSSSYIIRKFLDSLELSAQELHYRTYHDALTGLPNRLSIESVIKEKTESLTSQGECVAILMIDVIGFREINDTLGYALGDQLLVSIGNQLNEIDFNEGNVMRMGGDVFSFVCRTSHDRLAVGRLSNQIQDKLENSQHLDEYPVTIQVRVGIAFSPGDAASAEELIRCADVALAQAKSQRIKSYYYNTDLDTHSIRKLTLLSRLRTAIEQDELSLVYQPKVNIQSDTLVGVEVLVRWIDHEYGPVSPVEFITWAEKSGLIDKLTHWVLKAVDRQSAEWQKHGLSLPVAVNLSPTNLFDSELAPLVESLVGDSGSLGNGLLELEITENAVMEDPERALKTMNQLGDLGVKFAIDDFGTGLSSFAYLRKFPVDNLKIDRAFIIETGDSDKEAILLQSMITLGHQLGCVVTAEGVEDQKTLERLKAMQCNYVQGYHICKPLSQDKLLEWMAHENWAATQKAA